MTFCTKKILGLARSTDKGASTYKCTVCGELHLKSDEEKFRQKKLLSVFSILVLAVISGIGINHVLNETKTTDFIAQSKKENITEEIQNEKEFTKIDNSDNPTISKQQSEIEILMSKTDIDTMTLASNGSSSSVGSKGKSRNLKSSKRISRKEKRVRPSYHRVKSGETLYTVGDKYNISVTDLMNINNLSNNVVKVGQIIYLIRSEREKVYGKQKPKQRKQCLRTINELSRKFPYDWDVKVNCAMVNGKNEDESITINPTSKGKLFLQKYGRIEMDFCYCISECNC